MRDGDLIRFNGDMGRILMTIDEYNSAYIIVNGERFLVSLDEIAAV